MSESLLVPLLIAWNLLLTAALAALIVILLRRTGNAAADDRKSPSPAPLESVDTAQLLNAFFVDSPGYIFLKKCDATFSYTCGNHAFAALCGVTPSELSGKTDDELFSPDLALRIRTSNLEALRSSQAIRHKWYFTVHDRQIAMMCVQRVLHGADGGIYILGMGLDISGMERIERSLKRRIQEFRMLVDALPCELLLLDRDLFIISGNHAMLDALQLTPEVVRSHRGTELDSGFGEADPIRLAARDHQVHTAGNDRWQMTALPLTDDAGAVTAYAIWRIPSENATAQEKQSC